MHFDFSLSHPTIWVFFALLLIVVVAIYKGAHKAMAAALDARADKIRAELDEAKRLREEAQALLASFQRKQAEAEEQAKTIVEQARRDAETMAAQSRKDLRARLERRAELAEAKIAAAEAQAMADVKTRAVDIAMDAAQKLIQSEFKASDHNALVKDGIAQMGKALN